MLTFDQIKELLIAGADVHVHVNIVTDAFSEQPTLPEENPLVWFYVTERANLRAVAGQNDNGRMIMEIYPRDNSEASERIQLDPNESIEVLPAAIRCDGGLEVYATNATAPDGRLLYIRARDGHL